MREQFVGICERELIKVTISLSSVKVGHFNTSKPSFLIPGWDLHKPNFFTSEKTSTSHSIRMGI